MKFFYHNIPAGVYKVSLVDGSWKTVTADIYWMLWGRK